MAFHWRILNKILKLTTILMRGQWLGPKWNNYNMRWIFSLMIMNMPLLRIMFYLMEAHYLFSGLNHKWRAGWTLDTKGDQREQVGVETLMHRFWLPAYWRILYHYRRFYPKYYICMKSCWSLLSYATNDTSIGSLRRELCLFKWRLLQTHEFSTGPLWKAPAQLGGMFLV